MMVHFRQSPTHFAGLRALQGLQAAGAGSPPFGRSNHSPSPRILPLTFSNLEDGQCLEAGVDVGAQERSCGLF